MSYALPPHPVRLSLATAGIMGFFLLLSACQPSSDPGDAQTGLSADTLSESQEDALFNTLSGYLVPDTEERAERENNLLVNYAMDSLLLVEKSATGLFYQILEPGTGEPLRWGDRIKAHYRGTFPDGRVFDSSYAKGEPLTFYIGNMIPAWNEGLQLLRPGGRMVLLVPSRLGYGEDGLAATAGRYLIAPNQPLIFHIEVLEVVERGEY